MNWFNVFNDDKSKQMKQEVNGVFCSVEHTINSIINKIQHIDQLSDQEIKDIILRQHNLILNYDLFLRDDISRRAAQQLFTNERFLKLFLDISGLLSLSREEIICINKLAYDFYFINSNGIVNGDISNLLMLISHNINNQLIIKLYSKVGVNYARHLAMIANSSFKDATVVHRINASLIRCLIDLSLQDIVDIYCILFERISSLFSYTMFETKKPGMNRQELQRFDMISQAMIVLLHNLTSIEMRKVLYNYAYLIKINNIGIVRFRLKTVNDERIQKVISEVEYGDMEILSIP